MSGHAHDHDRAYVHDRGRDRAYDHDDDDHAFSCASDCVHHLNIFHDHFQYNLNDRGVFLHSYDIIFHFHQCESPIV